MQQANGLVQSSAAAVQVVGWAVAAALLALLPLAAFFALDAVSFLLSALLLLGIRCRAREPHCQRTTSDAPAKDLPPSAPGPCWPPAFWR